MKKITLNIFNGSVEMKKWFPVFVVNMIAGIFTYSLLIINQLVNQLDGMWHGSVSYANGHELSIGRWFWRFIDRGRFYLSPDPFTSVISLSLFILGFIFILNVLDVKSRAISLFSSLIFTVNISILIDLSYRYMSPTFALSFFLFVLASCLMIRSENKIIRITAPAVCISLATGLYQAYIGCTCLVILAYISLCLYKGDKSFKEIGMFTLRSIISAAIGMVLYYILLYVNLWHYDVTLDSYNGADTYGPVGMLLNLPESIMQAYVDFSDYFKQVIAKTNIFGPVVYSIVFLLLSVCLIYAFIGLFKENRLRAILFSVTILLVPIAANIVLFFAYDSFTSLQMTIPVSMSIPVLLIIVSEIRTPQINAPKIQAVKIYKGVVAVALSLLIYGNYIMTIYDQQAMYKDRQSLTELSREIITALQTYNLYHPYYKYVFVGSPADNPCFVRDFVDDKANSYAKIGTWDPGDTRWVVQSWQGFFTYEMGINLMVADDDKLTEALSDEAVRNMPIFPEFGCCALVNDVVVVKLSDNY